MASTNVFEMNYTRKDIIARQFKNVLYPLVNQCVELDIKSTDDHH